MGKCSNASYLAPVSNADAGYGDWLSRRRFWQRSRLLTIADSYDAVSDDSVDVVGMDDDCGC